MIRGNECHAEDRQPILSPRSVMLTHAELWSLRPHGSNAHAGATFVATGLKNLYPRDVSGDPGHGSRRNPARDFRSGRCNNDTHASKTNAESKLFRNGKGKEARLVFMGHVLSKDRHGLVDYTRLSHANGAAEHGAALDMVVAIPGRHRITPGTEQDYDSRELVPNLRALDAAPTWPRTTPTGNRPMTRERRVTAIMPSVSAYENTSRK